MNKAPLLNHIKKQQDYLYYQKANQHFSIDRHSVFIIFPLP